MTNSTATQPSAQVAELLRALPAFRITREWLKQHGTKGCGWNQTQIRALGIDWPPREGWTREIVGNSISVAQKRAFETAAKSPAAVSARNPGLHCTLSLLGTHTKLMSMHARDGAPAGDFLEWLSGVLPRLDATATTERSLKAIAEIAARFASDVEAHCKAWTSEATRLPLLVEAGHSVLPAEPDLPLDGSQVPRRLARALDAKLEDIAPSRPARQSKPFARVVPTRAERQRRAEEKHQQELAECRARSAERHREYRRQAAERRRMRTRAQC